jgi:hypothetical protein
MPIGTRIVPVLRRFTVCVLPPNEGRRLGGVANDFALFILLQPGRNLHEVAPARIPFIGP